MITVPIDRAAALRNAEKLLRQGKLEAAIAEYARVVEDQPTDWNTANTLGDLYVRAGQISRAVEQFTRIADSLSLEGFLPKASALYKKIIKLQPDDEHALVQAGEIAASQGLYADARSYLTAVAERRRARGDATGAAMMRVRLGTLDPSDYERRMAAAADRAELGELTAAVGDLKQMAAELNAAGRNDDAVEVLRRAVLLDPIDEKLRAQLLSHYIAFADFGRAREYATTIDQLKSLADALRQHGRDDEALDTLRDAVWMAPDDAALRLVVAKACIAKGDVNAAAELVTVEGAADDPALLIAVAEIKLKAGQVDDGVAAARRLVQSEYEAREQIASLAFNLIESAPDAALRLIEVTVDAAMARSHWQWPAAALQEFVRRMPRSVPALTRLIEICVDGGLDDTMAEAQGLLADAYLATGAAGDALVIAEDLAMRSPGDAANVERLRRALVLMNEPDPDRVIAERLRRPSLFAAPEHASVPHVDAPASEARVRPPADPVPTALDAPAVIPAPMSDASPRRPADDAHFELSANAIDIESILGELEGRPTAHATSESVEVDLSIVLNDIKRPVLNAPDVDGAFAQLRDEASRKSALAAAEADYTRGMAFRQAGDIDAAIGALQAASRAPTLRFASASELGRLFRERGMIAESIEWFERAAQAPAPQPADAHLVLYALADALEAVGETTRALAVCLELQADAGDYRDVGARIERLTRVQA